MTALNKVDKLFEELIIFLIFFKTKKMIPIFKIGKNSQRYRLLIKLISLKVY